MAASNSEASGIDLCTSSHSSNWEAATWFPQPIYMPHPLLYQPFQPDTMPMSPDDAMSYEFSQPWLDQPFQPNTMLMSPAHAVFCDPEPPRAPLSPFCNNVHNVAILGDELVKRLDNKLGTVRHLNLWKEKHVVVRWFGKEQATVYDYAFGKFTSQIDSLKNFDLVLLAVGSNDLNNNIKAKSVSHMLRKLCLQLRDQAHVTKVTVVGLMQRHSQSTATQEEKERTRILRNNIHHANRYTHEWIKRERGIDMVPLLGGLHPQIDSEGKFLNDDGQRKFADAIANYITNQF